MLTQRRVLPVRLSMRMDFEFAFFGVVGLPGFRAWRRAAVKLPDCLDVVEAEHVVGSDDGDIAGDCLSDEEAVKRIAVIVGKFGSGDDVGLQNGLEIRAEAEKVLMQP